MPPKSALPNSTTVDEGQKEWSILAIEGRFGEGVQNLVCYVTPHLRSNYCKAQGKKGVDNERDYNKT